MCECVHQSVKFELNLHCPDCGCEQVVATKNFVDRYSELGFTIKEREYKCQKCGKTFVLCPDCHGVGFNDSLNDCDTCNGMGLVKNY